MSAEDVQETLFFPLLGRADASRRWPAAFHDEWAHTAEQIARDEGTTAKSMGTIPAIVYGLRRKITVAEILRYLRDHPGAAIVNIGCGLDRLGSDLRRGDGSVDTSQSTVYNLDYPDVLARRSRWIGAADNEIDLPYSLTDHQWMDHVDAGRGMIAVAAGVFYYLEVDQVRAVIDAMAQRFPGGRLAYDSESPRVIRKSESSVKKSGVSNARMPFKVDDPFAVRDWSENIADVRVEFNFSHYLPAATRKELPVSARAFFAVMQRIGGMYEVVVDFA